MFCTKGGAPMAIPLAILCAVFVMSRHVALSDDNAMIPPEIRGVEGWFKANVKPLKERKGTLDPALEAAEANPLILTVRKHGGGQFKTITDAINSIKNVGNNTRRVIISIGGGEYVEKIKIDRTKHFITFYGSPKAMPTIVYGGTALKYGTVESATVIVESNYFVAANIIFKNSAPRPNGKSLGGQALALRITGDKAAFYNCKMIGFQDTLCDDRGQHFFKDCFIEGTVDFIFGRGKSLYVNTQLNVLGDAQMTVITAQARDTPNEDAGYSFVHCRVTGTGTGTYLGRAWMPSPKVIFSYSQLSSIIQPVGWSNNFRPEREKTVFFAEYQCFGPGANLAGRVKYLKQLKEQHVRPYLTLGYIKGSSWLLPPPRI